MLRYASSHRSTLIGLSLLGLLALVVLLLFVQAPAPGTPAIQPRAAGDEAASGTIVDPLANVNPADRKFYYGWYAPNAGLAAEARVPANVDPADRKFYQGWYASSAGMAAEPVIPDGVHPADRKFFIREYVPHTSR